MVNLTPCTTERPHIGIHMKRCLWRNINLHGDKLQTKSTTLKIRAMLCWLYLNPIIYWTVIENKRLGFGGRRSQATLWLHWKQIKKLTLKSPNNYSLLEQSPVANAQDEESLFSFLAISCIIKICFQWISCFHNHLLHIMRLFDTQELWIKTFLTCL